MMRCQGNLVLRGVDVRAHIKRFRRYALTGLGTNSIAFLIFVILIRLHVQLLAASALCYGLALLMSYLINRRWTFESCGGHRQDVPRFFLAYGGGLGVNLFALALLATFLRPEFAQLLAIGITAFFIYTMLMLLRFGRT